MNPYSNRPWVRALAGVTSLLGFTLALMAAVLAFAIVVQREPRWDLFAGAVAISWVAMLLARLAGREAVRRPVTR